MFLAGIYKRAAGLAILSIDRWLNVGKHIKTSIQIRKTGADSYGNFDKYMVTLSSFLAIAYLFTDESIPEIAMSLRTRRYVYIRG